MQNTYMLFVTILCLLLANTLVAQDTETQRKAPDFSDAENYYRQGRIDKSLNILDLWLKDKSRLRRLGKNRRADIYHLAAHCYILNDKPDTAQTYIKKMLKLWPDYKELQVTKVDLDRFLIAIDTLYTLPKLQIGVRSGFNYSFIRDVKRFPVLMVKDTIEVSYSQKMDFQGSAVIEYDFSKYIGASLEPGYTRMTHRSEAAYLNVEEGEDELTYNETIGYWDIGYLLNFKFFPRSKTRLIASIGGSTGLLYIANKSIDGTQAPLQTTNFFALRSQTGCVRIGGSHRRYGYAFAANVSYYHYFNWANDKTYRYALDEQASELTYNYYVTTPDFRFSSIQFNISWIYFINYNVYH